MKVCSDDVIPIVLSNTEGWHCHGHTDFCNPPFSSLLTHFKLTAAELVLLFSVKSIFVFLTGLYPLTTKQQYILEVLFLLYTGNRHKQQAQHTEAVLVV